MAQLRKTLWLREVLRDEKNFDRQTVGRKKIMEVEMISFA